MLESPLLQTSPANCLAPARITPSAAEFAAPLRLAGFLGNESHCLWVEASRSEPSPENTEENPAGWVQSHQGIWRGALPNPSRKLLRLGGVASGCHCARTRKGRTSEQPASSQKRLQSHQNPQVQKAVVCIPRGQSYRSVACPSEPLAQPSLAQLSLVTKGEIDIRRLTILLALAPSGELRTRASQFRPVAICPQLTKAAMPCHTVGGRNPFPPL